MDQKSIGKIGVSVGGSYLALSAITGVDMALPGSDVTVTSLIEDGEITATGSTDYIQQLVEHRKKSRKIQGQMERLVKGEVVRSFGKEVGRMTGVNSFSGQVKAEGTKTAKISALEENFTGSSINLAKIPQRNRKNIYFRTTTKDKLVKVTPNLNVSVIEDAEHYRLTFTDKNPLTSGDMHFVRLEVPKDLRLYGAGMCSIGVK